MTFLVGTREFSLINIRLNRVERGYQAKVYKFNNRKDDAVFSKAIAEEFYRPPSKQAEVRFLETAKGRVLGSCCLPHVKNDRLIGDYEIGKLKQSRRSER